MDERNRRVLPKTGYPRRRAVAACLTCRERKRKCDNSRPTCSSCQQIGTLCEYTKQDASTFDPATLTVLAQLSVIEGLVRNIYPSSSHSSPPLETSTRKRLREISPVSESHDYSANKDIVLSLNLESSFRAATDRILQWAAFDKLLSSLHRFRFIDFHGCEAYTYLDDLLSQSDTSAPRWLSQSTWDSSTSVNISTERSDIEPLVELFFKRVNIKNPILHRQELSQYCQQYYEHGSLFNLETCLVLLTCALGAVSMEFDPLDVSQSRDSPSRLEGLRLGYSYFLAAEKRLGFALSSLSTLAVQCLCLAGIYHMYIIRPMHALRMFHAAGSSLQILASTGVNSTEGTSRIYSNLFWTCYKSEREILAEIPISAPALREPGSVDAYPSPPKAGSAASNEWAADERDSWYFLLSEIALRRITDQVAEVVSKYIDTKDSSHNPPTIEDLIPIVAEFERQTEAFRENLPTSIKFSDVPETASTEWQQYSRGRYYRVLELMHRPFLFAAIHKPGCSPVIRALAEKSLFNALRYLQHSHISHRHHGTWLQLRNELKEASLLIIASKSAELNMPHGWVAGVAKALATFDYWGWEFPSCKSYTAVILTLVGSLLSNNAEEVRSLSHA